MISRVAESCFWLQRYVERAESTARLLRTTTLGSDGEMPMAQRWQSILTVTGEYPMFVEHVGADHVDDRERVLEYLTWDAACPVSIWSSWALARENARGIREAISAELWDICNRTWLWLQKDGRELYAEDPTEFYQRVREAGQLFRGAVLGTMLDDEPRWFMDLGLHLERVGQIARILDVKYHMIGPTSRDKNEDVQTMATWVQLLLACGAYEHFFRQRNSTVRGYRVVDVLVFSRSSPRSILYGLLEMEQTLDRIVSLVGGRQCESSRRLHALRRWLQSQEDGRMVQNGVHAGLTRVVEGVAGIGQSLYEDFFSPPSQVMVQE